ncbi:tRNA(Ile)-lysidine synthase [Bradyrhizobium sp. SSBR45G]|uniref:tRNA lysidine(34) synthetase TilS n=1 Tax=unclassified Bradyrhizobium TaxID=2631580 RepID=UPI0023428C81|nr:MULTISPECIES: tRNA lysidine(34) synthetase TilS [unclassified Bradyrhizobium]GLH78767.1 tRNA(Ile)-lysidine synthase [Bradyrhizobium sp. SSBR45G]GLH86519.1 tRNA(Ile)-lysidine synthase [Bradyrhizobium sp. SSBR45R]
MSKPRSEDDQPISAAEAERLLAPLSTVPALVLAVSGGPDSMALMWLAARWRSALAQGPDLLAVTVDHGLRPDAAREARMVKQVARELGIRHRTLRWTDAKPATGLPEAARLARYRLLARAARQAGASHVVTAHTCDDQAETVLMRLLRGSGIVGLAAMAAVSERDGLLLARPLLPLPKARLVATLRCAGVPCVDDPTNRDSTYTRPRLRALMPALAAEGGDARTLATLAGRLARANAALELMADGAEKYLALRPAGAGRGRPDHGQTFEPCAFVALPSEIRLRLLMRAINRFGTEGPVELGKAEALLDRMDRTLAGLLDGGMPTPGRLKQTLAGALVSMTSEAIRITPAPPRRPRRS